LWLGTPYLGSMNWRSVTSNMSRLTYLLTYLLTSLR